MTQPNGNHDYRLRGHHLLVGHITANELVLDVDDRSQVRLTGTANTVIISSLNGQSVIDLGELQADTIRFTGDMNGQSYARLRASGTIQLPNIDGQCLVVIVEGQASLREVKGYSQVETVRPGA